MSNLRLAGIAVLAFALTGAPALGAVLDPTDPGDTVTLDTLLGGADSITVIGAAGVTFDDFEYLKVAETPNGTVPAASQITVRAHLVGSEVGLIFEADPAWNVVGDGVNDGMDFEMIDAWLDFSVASELTPIVGVSLWIPEGAYTVDDGSVNVTETQYLTDDINGTLVAELAVRAENAGAVDNIDTYDSETFDPGYEKLYVRKDIMAYTAVYDGSASLAAIGQGFTIPEPATMALIAIGGLGLVLRRRRATLVVALLAAMFVGVNSAPAALVLDVEDGDSAKLSDVPGDGLIVRAGGVDQLVFTNFSLPTPTIGGGGIAPTVLDLITVKAVAGGEGLYGLAFGGSWAATFASDVTSYLNFDVAAGQSGWTIGQAALGLDRFGLIHNSPDPDDYASIEITEDVNDGTAASLRVYTREPDDAGNPDDIYDFQTFEEQQLSSLSVAKIITLESSCRSDTAMLSGFYQLYEPIVPEPATMSVLALGGLAVLIRRRK